MPVAVFMHTNAMATANMITTATATATASASASKHPTTNTPAAYILFCLITSFFIYCFWFGTVLARLWYYRGRVHGDFQKFDIQPAYILERMAARNSEVGDGSRVQGQWRAYARPMLDEDDVDDPVLKKQIMEEKRISRLPAFLQDDCGDASEFPDVGYGVPADEYNKQFDARTVDYHTLGLRRADWNNWLTVDKDFNEHMEAKKKLLDLNLKQCVLRTPAGREPSEELVPAVAKFLCDNFLYVFMEKEVRGLRRVENQRTKENWSLQRPYEPQALELLGRLAVEDFVFFSRDEFTAHWKVAGGSVCFPAGWTLDRIIGHDVDKLLAPVASWENLSPILDYMDYKDDNPFMKRTSTFIQTTPGGRRLESLLFVPEPGDFFQGRVSSLQVEDMLVRTERQTFHKLAESKAIVMTVKTELRALSELSPSQRLELAKEIRGWSEKEGNLKGVELWQRTVLGYCEGWPIAYDDETVVAMWE